MPKRRLNLVFQGGGVRGVAYAGVLDAMPPHLEVVAVAERRPVPLSRP